MADDEPPTLRETKVWPVEGHVIVPGAGLLVRTDCLGQSFKSRVCHHTGSYDLIIGLPRLDRGSVLYPLIAPDWDSWPSSESELAIAPDERAPLPWGEVIWAGDEDKAFVFRCRYYTELPAFNGGELSQAIWDDFNSQFQIWWESFNSWAAILASQDLVGPPEWDWSGPDLEGWSIDEGGQPAGFTARTMVTRKISPTRRVLEVEDLQACAAAAGNGPPPLEWQLIRDARSLLNARQKRRAVIDAATAAELAMTLLIENYLDDANALEGVRTAITRSANNLGSKKRVLELLRPDLVDRRVQEDLINKRNGASHSGQEFTAEEVQAALDIATAVVESAYPLAGLLPTQNQPPTTD
jgi:hypothetical protein